MTIEKTQKIIGKYWRKLDNNKNDHKTINEKNGSIESTDKLPQTAFLRSFETELDKVDEYFQTKAPDVRQAVLTSLQGMYHQNEWPDNPLTIICRDLDIHVRRCSFPFSQIILHLSGSYVWTIEWIKGDARCVESRIW